MSTRSKKPGKAVIKGKIGCLNLESGFFFLIGSEIPSKMNKVNKFASQIVQNAKFKIWDTIHICSGQC